MSGLFHVSDETISPTGMGDDPTEQGELQALESRIAPPPDPPYRRGGGKMSLEAGPISPSVLLCVFFFREQRINACFRLGTLQNLVPFHFDL